MERELVKFGGGVSQTVLSPIILIATLIAGVLIIVLPRNKAIIPFLAASILIPTDQVLLIGSLHFMMLRILILFGLIRILKEKASSKCKLFSGGMNKIDVTVIFLTVITAINWIILWQQSATLIFQLGEIYSVLGVYFLLRFLIRDQEDVDLTTRIFVYVTAGIAVVMVYEQLTSSNPYALLGGARMSFYASVMERDDRLRATGCFAHPILAGTFGSVLVPLFVHLWWTKRKNRSIAIVGIVAATVMMLASNSSTPVLAYVAGLLGLCLWPLRNFMRQLRWAIVLTLCFLHIVMKAPVWHLISRIDVVGGSSSYHRYQLVDQFIRHFGDWWLVGVKDNGQWGWDMWDTANQYVALGQSSGLLPFILFLAVIVYGFKYLGKARRKPTMSTKNALILWSLGAALFAHVVGFFGISYFDQTIVAWYALLAIISSVVARPAVETGPPRLAGNWEWATPSPYITRDATWLAEKETEPIRREVDSVPSSRIFATFN